MLLQEFSYFEGMVGILGLKVLFLFYKYGGECSGSRQCMVLDKSTEHCFHSGATARRDDFLRFTS